MFKVSVSEMPECQCHSVYNGVALALWHLLQANHGSNVAKRHHRFPCVDSRAWPG